MLFPSTDQVCSQKVQGVHNKARESGKYRSPKIHLLYLPMNQKHTKLPTEFGAFKHVTLVSSPDTQLL